MEGGRSLAETPTWSVATVTTILVGICFIVERSIHRFGEWLARTKRKPLLAALTKIKEELMLLGVMSLLLSQSARSISRFCVKSSIFSSRFYPCSREDFDKPSKNHTSISHLYPEHYQLHFSHGRRLAVINHCDEGHEPFVSYESLEQLHRFLFILGVTHVLYCCLTMLFAMIKIYSWRPWEIEAHSRLIVPEGTRSNVVMRRQTTFVFHHTEHPWSKNRFLVWVLKEIPPYFLYNTAALLCTPVPQICNKGRLQGIAVGVHYGVVYDCVTLLFAGSYFIFVSCELFPSDAQNHRLRLTYDFHSYMVRTMEDEFRDIVGISWPLWGYAIICIFFNLHGLNFYFWISFIPAILILFVGTKLQHVIAKLALDNAATHAAAGTQLKPRDQLFWFGKPQLLLWLIQFISFQNAFEMAAFVWSWWEIKAPTCFMKDSAFVFTRLISGVLVQFWCSYGILPLYAIVTQMGSRYKKALIREEIRESLHGWRKRVKEKAKRESLHPSSTSTKLETASGVRDKDETSNESIAYSFSQSPRNVIERSRSLPREIHITCQTENMGEDSIHEEGRQEEELGSHSPVYSFTADNNALHTFEANVMDDENTDEDSTEKHLLGPGSSNNGSTFELGVLEDDNIDEDSTDQHLPDPSEIP